MEPGQVRTGYENPGLWESPGLWGTIALTGIVALTGLTVALRRFFGHAR